MSSSQRPWEYHGTAQVYLSLYLSIHLSIWLSIYLFRHWLSLQILNCHSCHSLANFLSCEQRRPLAPSALHFGWLVAAHLIVPFLLFTCFVTDPSRPSQNGFLTDKSPSFPAFPFYFIFFPSSELLLAIRWRVCPAADSVAADAAACERRCRQIHSSLPLASESLTNLLFPRIARRLNNTYMFLKEKLLWLFCCERDRRGLISAFSQAACCRCRCCSHCLFVCCCFFSFFPNTPQCQAAFEEGAYSPRHGEGATRPSN